MKTKNQHSEIYKRQMLLKTVYTESIADLSIVRVNYTTLCHFIFNSTTKETFNEKLNNDSKIIELRNRMIELKTTILELTYTLKLFKQKIKLLQRNINKIKNV